MIFFKKCVSFLARFTTPKFKKTLREKLKQRYGDRIYFTGKDGRNSEKICFKDMSDFIIKNMKQTKESVVDAAAKIIIEEMRAMDFPKDNFCCVKCLQRPYKFCKLGCRLGLKKRTSNLGNLEKRSILKIVLNFTLGS